MSKPTCMKIKVEWVKQFPDILNFIIESSKFRRYIREVSKGSWLSSAEAIAILGISQRHFYRMVYNKDIRAYDSFDGNSMIFKFQDVIDLYYERLK